LRLNASASRVAISPLAAIAAAFTFTVQLPAENEM
jgi:hypothetical protein